MKNQLDTARNTKFLENSVQIVSDRVVANLEVVGDLTILHTLDDQSDHILFPSGQKRQSIGVDETS